MYNKDKVNRIRKEEETKMKQETGITLVTLVVTIIILIILAGVSINTLIGDNGIITKTKQARENIIYAGQEEQEQLNQLFWEMDQEGIYSEDEEGNKKDEMIELLQKQIEELKGQITEQEDTIKDLQNQWGELGTQLGQTNADAGHILKDYKAYSKGKLVTGTMANNGAVSTTLNCGQSYTIPTGYHNGSGKVTANSLASQTQATATAVDITSGKTAWINGQMITGTLKEEPIRITQSDSFDLGTRATQKVNLTNLIPNHTYMLVIYGKRIGSYNERLVWC